MPEQHMRSLEAFISDSQYMLASTSGIRGTLNSRINYRDTHPGVVESPLPGPFYRVTLDDSSGLDYLKKMRMIHDATNFTYGGIDSSKIEVQDGRALSVRDWYDGNSKCISWWTVDGTTDPRGGLKWINFSVVIPMEHYQRLWCCPAATEPLYQQARSEPRIIEFSKNQKVKYVNDISALVGAKPLDLDDILPLNDLDRNDDALYALGKFGFSAAAKDYEGILIEALAGILASKKVYIVPEASWDERIRLGCLLSATVPTQKGRGLSLITLEPRSELWKYYQVVIGNGSVPPEDERVIISKKGSESRAEGMEHKTATGIVEKLIKDGMQKLRNSYPDLYFS